MHRESESVIGQILAPDPTSAQQAEESGAARVALEEFAGPGAAGAAYSGPERRAQGYLIAEILPDSPPAKGQEPEFDRSR